MIAALQWWLALEALSFAAVPIAALVFRSLPDRGYAFTKVLGPLILAVALWWLGSLGVLPAQRGTVLLLTYLMLIGGLVGIRLLWRARDEHGFDRLTMNGHRFALGGIDWRAIALTEGVFAAAFFFWALMRAYSPDIDATEKPMNFAFLNASYRARSFPPEDPWLSGFAINYYYLGYLNAATLTKLAGVSTAIGFNLALATLAAQTAAAACGLAYNLAEGLRRADAGVYRERGPILAGGFGAVALVGIGNLEGVLEFVRSRGWGTEALWRWVDIRDLSAMLPSPAWYPTDLWFWWRATRIIRTTVNGQDLDYTITEFPFFSFLLGDLHPHVMALPIVIVVLGLALQVFVRPDPPRLARQDPLAVVAPAALLGALGFTNVWDLPTMTVLVLTVGGLRWLRVAEQPIQGRLMAWTAWATAVVVAAVLCYLPFYYGLVETGGAAVGGSMQTGDVPWPVGIWTGPGSRPLHLLLLWTPLFIAPWLFLGSLALSRAGVARWAALAGLGAPIVLWGALEFMAHVGPDGLLLSLWPKLWAIGPVAVALSLLAWTVRAGNREQATENMEDEATRVGDKHAPTGPREETGEGDGTAAGSARTHPQGEHIGSPLRMGLDGNVVFAIGLVAASLILLLLCEFVYVRDVFHNRMNTVFKLTYQARTFLAVASAFGLYYVYATSGPGVKRGAVWAAVMLTFAGAMVYAPLALANRADGFNRPPTLDGLDFVERANPAQRAAVDWLWQASGGRRTAILEASGPQYSSFALMSSRTGLPTLLGWAGHENQWRGPLPVLSERQQLVDQIYEAPNKAPFLPLLHEHQITYVIVGPAERSAYPPAVLDAFARSMRVAFRQDNVTIYEVPSGPE